MPSLPCFFLLLLGLAGCGGSVSPAGPSLVYTTDWVHAGQSGPDGGSQRLRLLKLDDTDVVAPLVLKKTSGQGRVQFSGFPAGIYRFRAELHSSVDGTGAITGVCERIFNISARQTFEAAVGTAPASIGVTPGSSSIVTPGSARFTATGFDQANLGAFLTEGAFGWNVTGPATVTADGIVVPSSTGTGTVTASLNLLTANAAYDSSTSTPTTTKWTVMVYMNAANNLEPFSVPNIDQMERVADNPNVRFVVQWKEAEVLANGSIFNGTKRYLVKPDMNTGLVSQMVEDLGSNVDMGDKQTMRDFVQWTKANYPANRYCLVVWNHGNGWRDLPSQLPSYPTRGVSYDDETGHHIDTADLPYALGPDKLAIVAWDASLMQMLEVAYQIKSGADFVVGSEESPPAEGFPYDLVFKPMHDNPDASTHDLTKGFIDGMLAVPGYANKKITESSIDTSQLPALATALDALANDLILNAGSFPQTIIDARNNAQAYLPIGNRVYRDLYDLCTKIKAGAGVLPSTITACQNVQTAIVNALAWEGHNSHSANSHGIAIDFSSGAQFPNAGTQYDTLALSNDTHWNEWLSGSP